MAVLDTTRTVAASALVLTPLNASWLAVSPDTRAAFETFVRAKASPLLWDGAIAWVLNQPGFAVFAMLAFLLYAIGYSGNNGAPDTRRDLIHFLIQERLQLL